MRSLFLACVLALSVPVHAQQASPNGRAFGLGLELGIPSTLNLKFMSTATQGVVVGIGGLAQYDLSLSLHADTLWHVAVISGEAVNFGPYFGVGAFTAFSFDSHLPQFGLYGQRYSTGMDYFALGLRIPIGLNLAFNDFPIELFAEGVPAILFFPSMGFFIQEGLGFRFYF